MLLLTYARSAGTYVHMYVCMYVSIERQSTRPLQSDGHSGHIGHISPGTTHIIILTPGKWTDSPPLVALQALSAARRSNPSPFVIGPRRHNLAHRIQTGRGADLTTSMPVCTHGSPNLAGMANRGKYGRKYWTNSEGHGLSRFPQLRGPRSVIWGEPLRNPPPLATTIVVGLAMRGRAHPTDRPARAVVVCLVRGEAQMRAGRDGLCRASVTAFACLVSFRPNNDRLPSYYMLVR